MVFVFGVFVRLCVCVLVCIESAANILNTQHLCLFVLILFYIVYTKGWLYEGKCTAILFLPLNVLRDSKQRWKKPALKIYIHYILMLIEWKHLEESSLRFSLFLLKSVNILAIWHCFSLDALHKVENKISKSIQQQQQLEAAQEIPHKEWNAITILYSWCAMLRFERMLFYFYSRIVWFLMMLVWLLL